MQFKTTGNEKILLVEDNLVNCEIAIDMLETIGFDADVANNGQQALDLYDRNQYILILMDCEMPVMDGYSATRHIRSREKKLQNSSEVKASIPIIALTAHVMDSTKEKCIAIGMNDFLGKPFNLSDLKLILSKWLETEVINVSMHRHHKFCVAHSINIDDIKSDEVVLNYKFMEKFYLKQKRDGSNLISNIINIYIDQSSILLNDLTEATEKKDAESARLALHTLKSSSDNVGALMFADLCRNAEKTCLKNNIDQTLLSQIYQSYSKVDKALKTILNNVGGW
ncbi:hypothetical protein MNBD_GAMMA06-1930 [hydrothermal vent metagenome]|uniref:Sensory box histidine kinase/response regulator n=1 Tax=hydrothermal vent metagenome TaxID=652676 RepID=A0A3B0WCM2_9ZZZZ